LTTLRETLIKIGAKVVRHARQVIFQMAEVAHTAAGLAPAGRKSREGEIREAALCLRSVENSG